MTTVIVADIPGGPEVLSVRSEPDRAPQPGEVAIDVKAIGVNPIDLKQRAGVAGRAATFPLRPGFEVSGVVADVGDDTGFAVGDAVLAFRITGGYASRVVVPAADVFHKPDDIGFDSAAGLLLVGVSAAHALSKVGAAAGETVLVHGAAGSVGQSLIQQARARGIHVIGTASPRNFDLLRDLGAIPVEYGDGLLARTRAFAPHGVDAAIDLVGTDEAIDVSLEVAPFDRVTTIVGGEYATQRGVQKIGGGPGSDPGTELRDAARQGLIDMAARGELATRVVARFPLTDAAAAHEYVAHGHAAGKVVLIP